MKRWLMLILITLVLTACGSTTTTTSVNDSIPTNIPTASNTPIPTAPIGQLKAGTSKQTLNFEGLERSYIVHLPPAITTQKSLPLVLMLHPATTNAEITVLFSGMSSKADKEGFIVVYPNGTGTNPIQLYWNSGHCCYSAMLNNINDVGYLRLVLENIQKNYPVDAKRIYVAGMSNGAMMAYRLGAEMADKIAAVGAVVGAMGGEEPQPAQAVSVISINGMRDVVVPYNGAVSRAGSRDAFTEFKPVSFTTAFWTKNNGTTTTPQKEDSETILKETYSGGKNGTEVVQYTLKNGGHIWPGEVRPTGKTDSEISATDLIWEFFKNHPKG